MHCVSPVIGGHHGFPYFSYEIIGTAAVRLRPYLYARIKE